MAQSERKHPVEVVEGEEEVVEEEVVGVAEEEEEAVASSPWLTLIGSNKNSWSLQVRMHESYTIS